MVRKIRQVRRKKGSKRGRPAGAPSFYIHTQHFYALCFILYALKRYQILIRSSGFLYSLSPGFTSNALYQASIFTGAPIVRYWLGE